MPVQSSKNGTKHPTGGTVREAPAALEDLSVFAGVATHGSFVQASRRLGIPTSTVSRAVARLEDALGVLLLRRTSRKVVLTDEGRTLYLQATPHLEGIAEALAKASDHHPDPSGVVRVTAPVYTGATRVAEALAGFALAYPRINVELDASNAFRDLLEDGYDFGVRVGPLHNPDFVSRRLWRGQFGLFASPAFVKRSLGGRTALSRECLGKVPCVAVRVAPTWRFRNNAGDVATVTPRVRFAVNDPRAALQLARRGLGIALSPLELVGPRATGLVRLIPDCGDPEPVDLHLFYPSRRLLPERVRLAIDWLTESCDGA